MMYDSTFIRWSASASIGKRIAWLIEASGYSQKELAEKMGLTQASVSNWITGTSRKPSSPSLLKLAEALGANPTWVITEEGDPFSVAVVHNDAERQLLQSFRILDPKLRQALIALAQAMSSSVSGVTQTGDFA